MPNTNRQIEALALRNQGYSYRYIAQTLGYSSVGSARGAVNRASRRAAGITSAPRVSATGPRRFGVEIEFNGISKSTAYRVLSAAGVNVRDESYNHATRTYWKLITDGSVSGSGLELVSPILAGDDGFAQLTLVMETLTAAGASVDRSCGMHVHHDMGGLTGEEIASFFEFYVDRQDGIDLLVAPSRRNGSQHSYYTRRVTQTERDRIGASFRARREAPHGERYRTINVQSFSRYETVEIRQHQGTLNAKKAVAWVKFGQSMITAARSGNGASVPTTVFEMIQSLTTDHNLAADAAEYLMGRALHFTSAE